VASTTPIQHGESAAASVQLGEARYRRIFDAVDVSIWEEDFSGIKAALDELAALGVRDFRRYFADHPEFVEHAVGLARIVDVNDTTVRMFGARDKAELFASLDRVFADARLECFAEELLAIVEGRPVYETEAVMRTLGGERRDVLLMVAFPPGDPSLRQVIIALTDITERKRSEQALRDSEEQLRFVTDHAPALIVHCDAEQHYKFVNAPYAARYGTTPEAIVGKPVQEILAPSAYEVLRPYVETALSGKQVEFEAQIPYEKIGLRWVGSSYVPQTEADGSVSGFFAVIHDITERKAAEEALRESEQRFRNMADHAPVMIWVSEADGHCSYMSKTWQEFTGQAPEDALGFGWLEAIHPEDRSGTVEAFTQARKHLRPFRLDYRLRRRDGEYRWTVDSAVPRLTPNGAFRGYIGSVVDITERKEMEEALREADRRKDEFLATLSHELRNPLAPLRSSVELLRMTGALDAENGRMLDMMDRQVNHLVRLVDDLLEMSRISRGTLELRKERVALAAIVGNAVETSEPLIEAGGHELTVSLPGEPLWLDGDPVRLSQIIANLLNNAAHYTEPRGNILLEARRQDAGIAITVHDNGRGIPAEALPRLFEMFNRGAHTPGAGGLGIGLALARQLAQMHGGTIEAHSEGLGKGSEFTIRLPLAANSPAARTAGNRAEPQMGRKRVLVVDDNLDAADTLGMLLHVLGADVQVAHNGPEALAVFQAYEPSVVLLDIGMPGMDGYEVARRLRSDFPHGQTTIIALTGWGQEEDRRRARDAGFDHHLVKPADAVALQGLLASLDAPERTGSA
jgi:PAS domain S-box-containing protein